MKKAAPDRINYLAQISQAVPVETPGGAALARLYGQTMAAVARKSVTRLHRQTKRQFCKKCFSPRYSSIYRLEDLSRAQNRPVLRAECPCGDVRRWPLKSVDIDPES